MFKKNSNYNEHLQQITFLKHNDMGSLSVINAAYSMPRAVLFFTKLGQTKGAENKKFVAHKGSIYISVTASTRQCALVTKLTRLCSHREQNKASTVQRVTLTTKAHSVDEKHYFRLDKTFE